MIFRLCIIGVLLVLGECQMQRRTLRVVSILDEPYLMQGDDGDNDKFEGMAEDLAEMVSDILGVDHEMHLVKDGKYGSLQNDSWNGMIGELLNGEADLAIAPLTISLQRAEVVDFSAPFQEFQLGIVLQKPGQNDEDADTSDETLTVFTPFSLALWLSIVGTLFGLIIISLIVEWSFKNPETHGEGFVNFLRQDSVFRPESFTGKIIRFVYLVFIIVVIAAYTASFSVQREADSEEATLDIESIEDLVKEDEMSYGIIAGGSTAAYLKSSDNPLYSTLYKTMDREESMVSSYSEGVERLRTDGGKFAFIIESPKAEYFTNQEPCDLVTVQESFGPSRGYAIATPKNSGWTTKVNLAILQLKENGKLEQLIKKFWNDIECSDNEDGGDDGEDDIEETEFDALDIHEMAGLFYFLFAGLILILLVWILERRCVTA